MITPVNGTKISAIRLALSQKGAGKIRVLEAGLLSRLKTEPLSDRLPGLVDPLKNFIREKLGIDITEIFCDLEGRLALQATNLPYLERVRNSNGNLGVLGHTVVIEMETEASGRLYLLKNSDNVLNLPVEPLFVRPVSDERIISPPVRPEARVEDASRRLDTISETLVRLLQAYGQEPPPEVMRPVLSGLADLLLGSGNEDIIQYAANKVFGLLNGDGIRHRWAGAVILSILPLSEQVPSIFDVLRKIADIAQQGDDPAVFSALRRALNALKGQKTPSGKAESRAGAILDYFNREPTDPLPSLLNMLGQCRGVLASARGEEYYPEHEYKDAAEILETINFLSSALDGLKNIITETTLLEKIDGLKGKMSSDVQSRKYYPKKYAEEALEVLTTIKGGLQLIDMVRSGAIEEIAEIEDRYAEIKRRSAETTFTPEEKAKKMNQLKAMGLELKYRYFDQEVVVPDWLVNNLVFNTDRLVDVVKAIGKNKAKALLEELLTSDSPAIINKFGVAPFIDLMKYFGSSETMDYLKWIKNNSRLIDQYGVSPYFVIAYSTENTGGVSSSSLWFLQDYFTRYLTSPEELAALGIFLVKKIASIRDPRMTYLNNHLQVFSPSSNEIDVILKELDQYLSFYQRIFNILCRPGDIGRDGGKPEGTFNSDFPKSKELIKKIGLQAFEKIIDQLTARALPLLVIIDSLEILQILESKSRLNSAEDLEPYLSSIDFTFSRYDRFRSRANIVPRNIGALLNNDRINAPFAVICKIAGLFEEYINSKDFDTILELIADLGSEKLSVIIDALPSPARSGILTSIRECAPFIETRKDVELFADMVKQREEPTLEKYLKRKG